MSGDVQPRKRKDKKKKRESLDVRKSEGELIFSRKSSLQDDESSHGVHITKMGSDDVHLHIHEEHGTGGHWCAKIIFFSLMALLMGLVCLIILENRGISDVDTPLSESRFSNYFDGWVDEHRAEHDDHHDDHGSLEHDDHDEDDEHDDEDHDEPFEEEADHSEGEEEVAEEEDENVTPEEEDEDDNATAENVTAEDVDEEEDEEEDDDDNVTAEEDIDDNVTAEEADDDNVTAEDENATGEQNDEDDEDDDDVNKTNEEGDDEDEDNATKETSKPTSQATPDDDDPFDEEEDDGAFDSLEKIVDNDAAELELLKEKARQQAAAESKQNEASAENDLEDEADNAPSWASSLAVKIGVGLALAVVARLVLLRKNPISNETPADEILIKRRLTLVSPDEIIPEHVEDVDEPLPADDYSEEEIEIEEEIEYIEEDEERVGEENQVDAGDNDYVPETFEQLNAMYRPKDYKEETVQKIEIKPTQTEAFTHQSLANTTLNNNRNNNNNNNSKFAKEELSSTTLKASFNKTSNNNAQNPTQTTPPVFEAPPTTSLQVQNKINVQMPFKEADIRPESVDQPIKKDVTYDMDYEKAAKQEPQVVTKKEVAHDMDYKAEAGDIDYDEDDIYDDDDDAEAADNDSEDLDEEDLLDDDEDLEEADDEEVSDVDDTELMSRLEAKYGKLPAKEYESDEDPDDPTWTQIKPKTGGGPQSLEDDELDLFEQELRRANDEMMREFNYH